MTTRKTWRRIGCWPSWTGIGRGRQATRVLPMVVIEVSLAAIGWSSPRRSKGKSAASPKARRTISMSQRQTCAPRSARLKSQRERTGPQKVSGQKSDPAGAGGVDSGVCGRPAEGAGVGARMAKAVAGGLRSPPAGVAEAGPPAGGTVAEVEGTVEREDRGEEEEGAAEAGAADARSTDAEGAAEPVLVAS